MSQCAWAWSSSVGADCPKRKLLTPRVIFPGCCFISVFAPLPPVQTPFPSSAEWGVCCGNSMAIRGQVLAFLLVLLPQLGKQRESSGAGAVSGKIEEGEREEGKHWFLLSLQKNLLLLLSLQAGSASFPLLTDGNMLERAEDGVHQSQGTQASLGCVRLNLL